MKSLGPFIIAFPSIDITYRTMLVYAALAAFIYLQLNYPGWTP